MSAPVKLLVLSCGVYTGQEAPPNHDILRPAIVFKERSRECRETSTINHLPGTGL